MNKTIPTEQDADQLFRAFFANEVPDPWPAFERPARQVVLPFRPAKPRRFVLGSKLALAASVALLMLCGWLLSGSFNSATTAGKPLGDPTKATAHPLKPDEHLVPAPVEKDKKADDGNAGGGVRIEDLER